MFPSVDIEFKNGQVGTVVPSDDNVFGVLASAAAVGATFLLETPYKVKSMADVAALGIIPSVDNYRLYKTLSEYYQEAGEGAELYIMGFARTKKLSDVFTVTAGTTIANKLLDFANGAITKLFTSFSPTAYTLELEGGIDEDVWIAANLAQLLSENYTTTKYAPFTTYIEGYGYDGIPAAVADLNEKEFNRVGILLGDTQTRTGVPASNGAAIGILAGKFAKHAIHENIGKVKNGSLSALKMYVLDKPVELADTETLHNKGYITFRAIVRKSGYFFSDDPLACDPTDDYHSSARRGVIDKAFRRVYGVVSEYILDEVPVTNTGTIDPFYAKALEGHIERDIKESMIAEGNLSFDINDPRSGVKAFVDPAQNIVSTSKLRANVTVRPLGYNRDLGVSLGFENVNQN